MTDTAAMLELSRRNDGVMVQALGNDALDGLRLAGLVSTRVAGDGYVIVRAIPSESAPRPVTIGYRGNRLAPDRRGRWRSPAEIGVQA